MATIGQGTGAKGPAYSLSEISDHLAALRLLVNDLADAENAACDAHGIIERFEGRTKACEKATSAYDQLRANTNAAIERFEELSALDACRPQLQKAREAAAGAMAAAENGRKEFDGLGLKQVAQAEICSFDGSANCLYDVWTDMGNISDRADAIMGIIDSMLDARKAE